MGEEIAENFLKKQGYDILDRNYRKKWGEIDIVAKCDEAISFIEVKTINKGSHFIPEANVYSGKQKRLIRASQTYLLDKKYSVDTPWQIDVIVVELDCEKRLADIRHLKNAVWE